MADSSDAILLKRRARRRLVGAVALVILVVVFLPLVLDQQPRTVTQPLTLKIPSQDTESLNSPVHPLPEAPRAAPVGEAHPASGKSSDKPRTVDVPKPRVRDKKGGRSAENRRAKAEETDARRAKALLGDEAYVVPLGTFAHADNVKQVQEKAAAAGIKSYTEVLKVAQGESTRVRAGPFASRQSAEKARQKLKSLGIEVGQVVQR